MIYQMMMMKLHIDNLDVAKKRKLNLLITAQNNAIRTNNIKAKINNIQKNNKCRLCSERDETVNQISK